MIHWWLSMGGNVKDAFTSRKRTNTRNPSSRQSSNSSCCYDRDAVRGILEDGVDELYNTAELTLGTGRDYREAYHDALQDVPDQVRLGDIDEAYAEQNAETVVALRYTTADGHGDWVDEQLDRIEDELGL